ncbi:GNAT family N-acetyltransferase [Halomonas sp. PGE1]|uniref:GNAT family N-acetyltransferase n=1 Tax=Halomonas sp. PGE1 TaxID=2730360 RepID=UPI001474EC48|nr:GNAT family N-acetyltransferase [Halomonas sp. PGE1]QJQ98914.1 GNAT family N-acetyltransferase [Halomonas sp. PGE1]
MRVIEATERDHRYNLMMHMAMDEYDDLTADERAERFAMAYVYALPETGVTVLAAEYHGSLLGYAILTPKKRGAAVRLHWLYVGKAARGCGVGSVLVKEAVKRYRYLQLACHPRLKPYYQRFGFSAWRKSMNDTDVIGSTTKKGARLPFVARIIPGEAFDAGRWMAAQVERERRAS